MSYVEPTTGAVYSTRSPPYFSVEGLFNDKNYWVNMQQQKQQRKQRHQRKDESKRTDQSDAGGASDGRGGETGITMERDEQNVNRIPPLSFDLLDGKLWEYVFIDPMQEVKSEGRGRGNHTPTI